MQKSVDLADVKDVDLVDRDVSQETRKPVTHESGGDKLTSASIGGTLQHLR